MNSTDSELNTVPTQNKDDLTEDRMKIMVVAEYFYPSTQGGGGLRSLLNLIEQTRDGCEYVILAGNQDVDGRELDVGGGEWTDTPYGRVGYLTPERRTPGELRRRTIAEAPAMIACNSFFSSLCRKMLWLRFRGSLPPTPVATFLRGELFPHALAMKRFRKSAYLWAVRRLVPIYRDVWFCACGTEEAGHVRKKFPHANILEIPDAVVLPDVSPEALTGPSKRPGEMKLVFLGRLSPIKNLALGIEALGGLSARVELDIYGPLEDKEYWRKCERIIESLPPNISVRYNGVLDADEVMPVLAESHFMLMPTRGENFGHVIAESLSAGTPVLLSDRTPWTRLESAGAGWIRPIDSPEGFGEALEYCAAMDQETYRQHSQAAMDHASDVLAGHGSKDIWRSFVASVCAT